jgi:hypothetical protein
MEPSSLTSLRSLKTTIFPETLEELFAKLKVAKEREKQRFIPDWEERLTLEDTGERGWRETREGSGERLLEIKVFSKENNLIKEINEKFGI